MINPTKMHVDVSLKGEYNRLLSEVAELKSDRMNGKLTGLEFKSRLSTISAYYSGLTTGVILSGEHSDAMLASRLGREFSNLILSNLKYL